MARPVSLARSSAARRRVLGPQIESERRLVRRQMFHEIDGKIFRALAGGDEPSVLLLLDELEGAKAVVVGARFPFGASAARNARVPRQPLQFGAPGQRAADEVAKFAAADFPVRAPSSDSIA